MAIEKKGSLNVNSANESLVLHINSLDVSKPTDDPGPQPKLPHNIPCAHSEASETKPDVTPVKPNKE
jgi:hypothetical protein